MTQTSPTRPAWGFGLATETDDGQVVQQVPATSDTANGFAGYLQYVGAKARGQGVSQTAIDSITNGLTYNTKVVALDRAQPGSTPGSPPAFWAYYNRHIGAAPALRGGQHGFHDFQALVVAHLRVAGPNPMLIKGIDAIPANFGVTAEQYAGVVAGDTLSAALSAGRLFLCDYAV